MKPPFASVPGAGEGKILDFDIENRPLSYWIADRPTAEITAIASMWVGDHDSLEVWLLGPPCFHRGCPGYSGGRCSEWPEEVMTLREMLARFTLRYNEATLVTGHYIRRHDLPIINGSLYELGMPLLSGKMSCDTKLDMFKKADIPASQEFLLELLKPVCPIGMQVYKEHMTQHDWREANRLLPEGLRRTAVRVGSDVHSHSHMRDEMLRLGMLRAPSMWNPGGGASEVTERRTRR